MDELLQQVADKLDVSTKYIVENYPQLRDQFVLYDTLSNTFNVLGFLSIVGTVALVMIGVFCAVSDISMFDTYYLNSTNPDHAKYKKMFKIYIGIIIGLVIFAFLLLIASTILNIMCPDAYIIQRIING